MKIIDQVTMAADVIGRVTVTEFNGRDYAYFFVVNTCVRYEIDDGQLTLDSTWKPGPMLLSGQTPGWALVVMNNWIVGPTNGLPASTPLSVFAVNQGDASKQFTIQPFAGDPIPLAVRIAFSRQGPGGTQAVSWNSATVSVDPELNLIYALDALPGEIAGLHLGFGGLATVWKAQQTTTEFIAIIGPPGQRVIVGSNIPGAQIPDANFQDEVVWRNAATGQELARSARLPKMTTGTMVQPYYFGDMFYPGAAGSLYKLQPEPAGGRPGDTHDFNADGNSDIIWRDSSGDIAVWLMSGAVAGSSGSAMCRPPGRSSGSATSTATARPICCGATPQATPRSGS